MCVCVSILERPLKMIVTQLHLTLCSPMDCSSPVSAVHGILQAGILEWVAIPFSKDLPEPGIQPWSPALPSEPPNKDLKIRILFLQKKKGGKRQSTSVINLL